MMRLLCLLFCNCDAQRRKEQARADTNQEHTVSLLCTCWVQSQSLLGTTCSSLSGSLKAKCRIWERTPDLSDSKDKVLSITLALPKHQALDMSQFKIKL